MKWGPIFSILGVALIGCALDTSDDVDASSEDIVSDPVTVARAPDGGFKITSTIPARCAGCKDDDRDGLNDAWEDAVLAKITPFVTFDEEEPLMQKGNHDSFGAIGRVFPFGDRIVVSVLFLYTKDYGAQNPLCFHSHNHAGDVERAALELKLTGGSNAISVAAYTTAHEGTEDDQTTIVDGIGQKLLEDIGGHWRVYSAQNKHGTYMSKAHCENARLATWLHRFCASEDCAPDNMPEAEKARFTVLPKVLNVGELGAPRNDDLTSIGFPGEHAWGADRFCGGLKGLSADDIKQCPDALKDKLPKNPFAP
jgi:hypothetical protein